MIDGIELDERCHVVALGITVDGTKVPLGLWADSTENATVATALLSDLVGCINSVSCGGCRSVAGRMFCGPHGRR